MTNGIITDEAWERLIKETGKSRNTIDLADFSTNDNSTEFGLDFSADVLDFDPWNLDEPTALGGVTRTLSPPAYCTMFNLTAAFDPVPPTKTTGTNKESQEELKFQVRELQIEYLSPIQAFDNTWLNFIPDWN